MINIQLQIKCLSGFSRKKGDMERIFNEQLEKCGVEYFDYYLVHSVGVVNMEFIKKFDAFKFVEKMKKEGKILHIGFSFHDKPEMLEELLKAHPESEFVQIQLNYLDWNSASIESKKCYDLVAKYRRKCLVMEPVKGGTLAKIPEEVEKLFKSIRPESTAAEWAIRFAASQPNVFKVLSGMSTEAQLDENTRFMKDFEPLSPEEEKAVMQAAKIIRSGIAVPCTGCRYCVDTCPQNIPIPDYFSVYNTAKQFGKTINETVYYGNLSASHGKASSCIECGACENHCPQHLEIRKALKDVAAMFDVK